MKLSFLIILSLLAFISPFFRNDSPDKCFEVNLIKNSGFEEKAVGNKIQHWMPTSTLTDWSLMHATYGEKEGEWKSGCNEKCGLAPNSGKSYFRLPLDKTTPQAGISQEIDLSPIADITFERRISVKLRGFIAGATCGIKKCVIGSITESFYDKDGKRIDGEYSAGLDLSLIKSFVKGGRKMYEFRSIGFDGELPKETVKVIIKLEGHKTACCEKVIVFFDNLSYVLSKEDLR